MQADVSMGAWGVLLGVAAGAVRGSIPYLFVSLGECLTEKSGKINLGMEGVLLMGAMTAFAVSDWSGSPWLGLAAAAAVGAMWALLHAGLTRFPKVSDVASGIAMILFGSGLAFFFGKKFVAPMAPQLPAHRSRILEPRRRRCIPRYASALSSSGSRWHLSSTSSSGALAGACRCAPRVTTPWRRAPSEFR